MHKWARIIIGRGPDQCVQPYQFGHPEQKQTCLWLKGLPELEPTDDVEEEMLELPESERQRIHWMPPGENRSQEQSRFFPGIARAMAEQWRRVE